MSGLDLGPATRGTARTVYELAPATLEALGHLPRADRQAALRHLLAADSHPVIDAFVDALERGEDPAAFGRGGVLVPAAGFRRLTGSTVDELLGRVAPHGRWVALAPDRTAWEVADPSAGAPAVLLADDVDYTWHAPEGTTRILGIETTPVADPRVRALRWIASRIARVAEPGETAEETVRRATEQPSRDALIAARVLERERAGLAPDDAAVPGFRAPAEWFGG